MVKTLILATVAAGLVVATVADESYTTVAPAYTPTPSAYTTAPPSYTTAAPKCIKQGDECDLYGMMKCCKDLECVESGKYDYTYSCEPVEVYTTAPPVYTTAPPAYTTVAPKCIKQGDECDLYGMMKCCKDLECVESGKYDYTYSCEPVDVYTTAPPVYTTAPRVYTAAPPEYTTTSYTPKCRAEGDRCIGAFGYPSVEWLPCCDGYECAAEDKSKDGYGLVCAEKYAPKCRAEGERCIGAPGKPRVDWIPCCDGYECSAEDKSKDGYGLVCAAPVYTTPPPVYTTAPPVYTTAPPVYTTAPPVYTTAPPSYTTVAPKCNKQGDECDLYGMMKCCKDLECVESGKYDYTYSCEPVEVYTTAPPVYTTAPPAYTTVAPKCIKQGDECDLYGMMKCCKDLECVESGKYDYTYSCEPVEVYTTAPPAYTTASKCVEAGEKCDEYISCCEYAQCVMDDYGNSSTCKAY